MKKTFVIIVHYGSLNLTLDCLETLNRQQGINIVVVDNSLNSSLAKKLNRFSDLKLLTPQTNLGFAGANNTGIKYALDNGAEYLLLLNNDTLVPPEFLNNLIKYAEKSPKLSIISPKIYFAKGFEFQRGKYKQVELGKIIWYAGGKIDWNNIYASHRGVDEVDHGQYDSETETEFATGCCLLLTREVISKIGLLPEDYFLYYEDVDYSQKAKLKGIKVVYYPGVFIYHKNAGSSSGPGSLLHRYYQTRNRLMFGLKYAPLRNKLPLIKESIKFIFSGGIKARAVVDFYIGRRGNTKI